MEDYIPISHLNDFMFCPRSIYLHAIYGRFNQSTYHSEFQTRGRISHDAVDEKRYSTRKDILQGTRVYSEKLGIMGRIDVFNKTKGTLVERKFKIKVIQPGYLLQLYAQYFCLTEMGYQVNGLYLHSLSDNKRYRFNPPGEKEFNEIAEIVRQIHAQKSEIPPIIDNTEKCNQCIYKNLCHK